jgi:cytoskeletal protein CcmA (bactofilin family)
MFRVFMAFLIGSLTLPTMAQDLVTRDLGADHFAAGVSVTVSEPVAGDLVAAGRAVALDGTVAGDAVAAGGSVRLNGTVSQNAYAAGGQVFVNGAIARNARIAGGEVEIGPSSRIEGGVSIGAGEARVSGSIAGYLQAAAGNLYINGPISGDVEAAAGQVELGPNTRIAGTLRYRSDVELRRDPAAQVLGGIERLPAREISPGIGRGLGRAMFWIWNLGLMLVVTILLPLLPGFFAGVSEALQGRPGLSVLLGFAMLIFVPAASLFLLFTLIGVPLGLLCIAAYFALLVVGYIATGACLGDWLLKRLRPEQAAATGWRVGAAIGGIFLIALLGQVPLLGGLVVFAAMLMGIGAVVLQMNRTLRPAPAISPSGAV